MYAPAADKFVAKVRDFTPESVDIATIGIYDTLDAAIQARKQFLRERRKRPKAVVAGESQ
jgi:hypothetical protein